MPIDEAIVARLREYAARWHAPCPFAVGDIVTARPGSDVVNEFVGVPALVLEVLRKPYVAWHLQHPAGTGRIRDMRVAVFYGPLDTIVDVLASSWEWESLDER